MDVAVVAAYETKQGKRYRVRYRTPDNRQTDKRGFRTKRDAERFLNTVELAEFKGKYVVVRSADIVCNLSSCN